MNRSRTAVLAGAAALVAIPVIALGSPDDRRGSGESGERHVRIVNPALPDACVPPGLTKGQPLPPSWIPPRDWQPSADCRGIRLTVRQDDDHDDERDDDSPSISSSQGGDGEQTVVGTEQADAPATFPRPPKQFYAKSWGATAFVFNVDTSKRLWVIDADIERVARVPRSMRRQARFLRDYGAYVLIGPKARVRIVNTEAKTSVRGTRADIDVDSEIRVRGRFLRMKNWRTDADGDRVPTMRAARVDIIDSEPGDGESVSTTDDPAGDAR